MKRLYWQWGSRRQRKHEREERDRQNRELYDHWAKKIREEPDSPEYKAWSDYWSGNPPPLDRERQ